MSRPVVAWEDPEVPFPANLALTWWASLSRPGSFFQSVNWGGALSRPLYYWLLIWVISGALMLLWPVGDIEATHEALFGPASDPDVRLLQLLSFFLTPFVAVAALAVGSVSLHVFARLLSSDGRPLADTARAVCYACGPMVLGSIPLPGVLAWFWAPAVWILWIVLLVLGQREAHRVTAGRAAAIVLLPLAIAGTVLVLLVVTAFVLLTALPRAGT